MVYLNQKLPYEKTVIPPEQTQFQISAMLNEFVKFDENKKKIAWVNGIQWTDMPEQMPYLVFRMEYDTEDAQGMSIHKTVGIKVQPPLLAMPKKDRYGNVEYVPAKAQSMRLMFYWMKSKLEAVLWGLRDFTEEFMGDVVVNVGGKQVRIAEVFIPQLEQSKLPALTFDGR